MEDERKDTFKSLESNFITCLIPHSEVIFILLFIEVKGRYFIKTTFVILELSFQTLVCIHSDIHMKALIVIRMK